MVINIKDVVKFIGISIIACCAVLVCTLFLNYYFDLQLIEDSITSSQAFLFYDAQVTTAKVVCFVSGGCLLITSIIMLFFYIKHYIDTHKKELGILKALGYSNWQIAKSFWVFGTNILFGTLIGYLGAFLIMPSFYTMQNEDHILPEITIHFQPAILFSLVILPSLAFAAIAVIYACMKLKKPVLMLLKNTYSEPSKVKKLKDTKDCLFIKDVKKSTLKSKKTLAFFIVFASFCFSSMTQMSASMKELSSEMMGIMIFMIGIVLAFTTLFIAITTVIKGNTKTIAMMRVFGYSHKECCHALLDGYRMISYIGFVIGTLYQYMLIKMTVDIVFKGFEGVPAYEFDDTAMWLSLLFFILTYELIMYVYSEKIKKITVKEIMTE